MGSGGFSAFQHRGFLWFWLSAIVSNTGTLLNTLAVPFVLYQLTESAIWVAWVAIAQWGPQVLFGPLSGLVADRYQRRHVLLVTQTGMAAFAGGLYLSWQLGARSPLLIVLLVGGIGVLGALNGPSWQAFVNDLVPRSALRSAVAMNSLQYNFARLLGPALGGLLLATLGAGTVFLLNALSFGAVILVLALIRPLTPQPLLRHRGGSIHHLVVAVRYIASQPGLRMSLLLTVALGLFGNPLFSLVVVLAEDIYRVDAFGLGILSAAIGLGGILAAPLVAGWKDRIKLSQLVTWGMASFGITLAVLGVTDLYGVALAAMIIVGVSYLAVNSSLNTALQMLVADGMRGRVFAVRLMSFLGSIPIGTLLQSVLCDLFSAHVACLVAAAGMLLSLAAAMVFSRDGQRLRSLDQGGDGGTAQATSADR